MPERKLLERIPDWPMARFLVIGGVGIIVDAGILVMLIQFGGDAYTSRLVSFAIAVLVT